MRIRGVGRPGRPSRAGEGLPAAIRSGERGFALATALFVVLLISIALSLVAASLTLHLRLAREEAHSLRRSALADAALAEALAGLAADPSFPGQSDHPFGEGSIGSHVDHVGLHHYRIEAHAAYAGRRRAAEAEVARTPAGEVFVTSWRPASRRP